MSEEGPRLRAAVYYRAARIGIPATESGIAKATGVSRGALRRVFQGGEPDLETLRRLARPLGTSAEWLLLRRAGRDEAALALEAVERLEWEEAEAKRRRGAGDADPAPGGSSPGTRRLRAAEA